jgi:Kinesin motor domain
VSIWSRIYVIIALGHKAQISAGAFFQRPKAPTERHVHRQNPQTRQDRHSEQAEETSATIMSNAGGTSTKVRVGVRVRPLNSREGNPVLSCCGVGIGGGIGCGHNNDKTNAVEISGAQFKYDHVFDSQVSQEELYHEIRPMLSSFLEGFNATVSRN